MKRILAAGVALLGAACTTTSVELPASVTTTAPDQYGQQRLDEIQYDRAISADSAAVFSALRRCAVTNLTHEPVAIRGGQSTYLSPLSGQLFRFGQTETIGGSDTLVFEDADEGLIVARAQTDFTYAAAMTNVFVRFMIIAEASDGAANIQVREITSAFQSSGSIANDGFSPVGAWAGARPLKVIESIDAEVSQYLDCVQTVAT